MHSNEHALAQARPTMLYILLVSTYSGGGGGGGGGLYKAVFDQSTVQSPRSRFCSVPDIIDGLTPMLENTCITHKMPQGKQSTHTCTDIMEQEHGMRVSIMYSKVLKWQ